MAHALKEKHLFKIFKADGRDFKNASLEPTYILITE